MSVKYLLLAARALDSGSASRKPRYISPLLRASVILLEPLPVYSKAADFNPHHSPENGQFCEADGVGSGLSKTRQEPRKPLQKDRSSGKLVKGGECTLATPAFGFQAELDEHWEKHGSQYPGWTKEQYEQHAVWLAEQAPKSGGVRGYEMGKHIVVRYDPYNNDYVKADIRSGVVTMFKPDDKAGYYEMCRRKEGNKK